MASKAQLILHDNVIDGMDYTTPPHLIGMKWRHQHNMRLTPNLEQIPRKKISSTVGSDDILHIGIVPGTNPGTGKTLLWTKQAVFTSTNVSLVSGLSNDSSFRRWSTALYNGRIYYANELNPVRENDGSSDQEVANAPAARYCCVWYDHLVAAYVTRNGTTSPNRFEMSDVYKFDVWEGAVGNEAEHYDFVEWQMEDYPYVGITGMGKLRGTLWFYTPTAIIPVSYVGLPKIIQVQEQGIVTRTGNTFPWTMVPLDNVHFYFDYLEHMFFAFDGGAPIPIGEPVRQYLLDNLNTDYDLASKMYGFVDVDNREIWWPFVSVDAGEEGEFDKAVVFNYRYKRWYTASVENVLCFSDGTRNTGTVGALVGAVEDLTGDVGHLSIGVRSPRLYGTADGVILTDSTDDDVVANLLDQDDPILETPDFHFGDLRTIKETDLIVLNAYWDSVNVSVVGKVEVWAIGRNFLSEPIEWNEEDHLMGNWKQDLQDATLSYNGAVTGRVIRYKFVGKNLRDWKMSGWSDAVQLRQAEK